MGMYKYGQLHEMVSKVEITIEDKSVLVENKSKRHRETLADCREFSENSEVWTQVGFSHKREKAVGLVGLNFKR